MLHLDYNPNGLLIIIKCNILKITLQWMDGWDCICIQLM